MNREQASELASHWVASWNARDVEAVLGHFHDDVRFTSPKAATITGNAVVSGKSALRAYWTAALSKITSLRFTLDRALFDDASGTLTIVYRAELNGQSNRACEFLRFGSGHQALEGEAMYGAGL